MRCSTPSKAEGSIKLASGSHLNVFTAPRLPPCLLSHATSWPRDNSSRVTAFPTSPLPPLINIFAMPGTVAKTRPAKVKPRTVIYDVHIFVCTNQRSSGEKRSCGEEHGHRLVAEFKKQLKEKG